jgi:hypothetical protein
VFLKPLYGKSRLVIVGLVATLIMTGAGAAEPRKGAWAAIGLGASNVGIGAGFNLSFIGKGRFNSIRFLKFVGDKTVPAKHRDYAVDIGLLEGKAWRSENGAVKSISIGGGWTYIVRYGDQIPQERPTGDSPYPSIYIIDPEFEEERTSTFGFIMQAQWFTRGAFGIQAFANINKQESFGGVLLCSRLGN